MTDYAIIAGAVIAAGAYMKWAARPVLLAYELGKAAEHVRARWRPASAPPPWPGRHWPKEGSGRG